MEISEYAKMSANERVDSLQATCEEVMPDFRYSRKITQKEKDDLQSEISLLLVKNQDLAEEVKIRNAEKAANTKIIIRNNNDVIAGFITKKEKVYKVINSVTGYYEYINEDGIIVEKERLLRNGTYEMNLFKTVNE